MVFFSSIISFIAILLGWVSFGVSPLYTFQEIAYQQEQNNLKRDFVYFHNDLGNELLDVEQIDAARNEFKQVLEVDPLNQEARLNLFKCEVFSNAANSTVYDPEIVKKQLDEILEKDPNDPHVYLYYGDLAHSFGEKEKALEFYQKAISLDDSVANAYAGIGYIYNEQNKTNESLEMYNKALNLSYWNIIYRNNIAVIYYDRKEYQNATACYDSTCRLNYRYLLPYYRFSSSYRLTGDLESALYYQEILVELLKDDNVTSLSINQCPWYLYAESREPIWFYNNPEKMFYACYDIALTYYLLGDEDKATEYMDKANDLNLNKNLKLNVMKLVNFDIKNLEEEQPNLQNKIKDFRKNLDKS